MIDERALTECLNDLDLQQSWQSLIAEIPKYFNPEFHGDMKKWRQAIADLPAITAHQIQTRLSAITISSDQPLAPDLRAQLISALQILHPWRKGPFDLFGVYIDTEWRSDLKWERVAPYLQSMQGRAVLDIGCGSGYHLWRMLGAGARYAIGVEPSLLFNMQFHAINRYIQSRHAFVLPFTAEQLSDVAAFDSVFSMGVLYHRPSPIDHLLKILALLKPGGQMIVETLVLPVFDNEQGVLCPNDRYAQMRNVWFIPTIELMLTWMQRCGVVNPRVVDVTKTTIVEQRQTEWMRFHSLQHYLNPDDENQTVEGYPAPTRAIFIGEKAE